MIYGPLSQLLALAALLLLPTERLDIDAASARMEVSGTSTVHDWSCAVESVTGWVNTDDSGDVASGAIQVPAGAIECGKRVMNRKLRDALRAEDHPVIEFRGERVVRRGDALAVEGRLSVAGTTAEMTVPVEAVPEQSGYRLSGTVTLSLEALNVDRPSAVLGTIKTGDEVTVSFSVLAIPGSAS
ncbi:MAG: YceI family protein [Rhodothermales bacterium]|nr:YceI family protein [Rhodothermales bacterium]MBO6779322.1 YceI family protein [Rhodothermales bacterium]